MKINKPSVYAQYWDEPSLLFSGKREHVSQKLGITTFGPYSLDDELKHPSIIKVGIIGSGRSLDSAKKWLEKVSIGVSGEGKYIDFPGFLDDRGFFSKLTFDDRWDEIITQREISSIIGNRNGRLRFEQTVDLLIDKIRLISQKDNTPSYVILAIPDEIYNECKVVDYKDGALGDVHRDLRRAVKARSMQYRLPTQILLQRTSEATTNSKLTDHQSNCAWNVLSSLYFKSGGIPWNPKGLMPDSCYVGVSFHRVLGNKKTQFFTSVAQAFDEHGNGLVLRGQDFSWDENEFGRSPHLTNELASDLITNVLKRYQDELKRIPVRVVVQKTSNFWPEEKEGIEYALKNIYQYDLLAIAPDNRMRLLRDGQYPVLRGTQFSIGEEHYLYTTGYIAALQSFPHGHIPSPLKVYDHKGDSSIDHLLREVLVLSKMNWNTANFAGLLPVTLRFSGLVGDILREMPDGISPQPQFKYYM